MNNRYLAPAPSPDITEGLFWPEHRALPVFASPAETLDAICTKELTPDEKLLFTCLEGLVNRRKPRLFLVPERNEEGPYAWPELLGLKLNEYTVENRWEIVKKYADAYRGIVLYNAEKCEHYVNLATTVSGLDALLPVSVELYETVKQIFPDLEVKADLTTLPFDNAVELYRYGYKTYWNRCTHKLIVSAAPRNRHYIRDLAVACGCFVIWTENRRRAEKAVYSKFLADMEAGNALATGWYTEERSGIGAAAEYGLSTVPSDYFENATVYAGMKHEISIPAIPKTPKLENKIYIAIYLSDGDNVQYNQHAMLNLWRNPERGTCPINWTISPALADFAPGMLNYFYDTASEGDCFVSGPSGLGYSLLIDRHNKLWNLTDRAKCTSYAQLTERYLNKTGIHSITVWDEMDEMHTEVYADVCRNLYGATMVEWYMAPKLLETMTVKNTAFIPNTPGYTPDINAIHRIFKEKIDKWDRQSPLFLSAQGVSWNMTPANIKELAGKLDETAPGCIEILRADHFFCLYNQAHGLSYNLSLTEAASEKDGIVDLGQEYTVTRVKAELEGAAGFELFTSADGENWALAESTFAADTVYDFDLVPVTARYVKIVPMGGQVKHTDVFGK